MATDPYAAPKAHVEDVQADAAEGEFIPSGQGVVAGNGWQWIVDGWAVFKRQPGTWILITVVWFLILLVLALIPFIGGIANNLLFPAFLGGVLLGCREIEHGQPLEFGHLFAGFRDAFGKLVLVGVFYLVALIACVIVAALFGGLGVFTALRMFTGVGGASQMGLGGLAMALTGLIVLALLVPVWMAMWFAPALIVFHDFDVTDALKASFAGCLKNVVPFLLYGVILFVLMIFASLPVLLGWLVLGPTVLGSVYASYRDIYYAS